MDNTINLVLHKTIGGKLITTIGGVSISKNPMNEKIQHLRFTKNVNSIFNGAFENSGIETVKFSTIGYIGKNAFSHNEISDIYITFSINIINDGAFSHNKLKSVVIGQTYFDTIYNNVFEHNQIEYVDIPFVKHIGKYAFSQNKIKKVLFANNLKTICAGAFMDNEFERISLPDSVTYIGPKAFTNNMFNGPIILPDSLSTICANSFDMDVELFHHGKRILRDEVNILRVDVERNLGDVKVFYGHTFNSAKGYESGFFVIKNGIMIFGNKLKEAMHQLEMVLIFTDLKDTIISDCTKTGLINKTQLQIITNLNGDMIETFINNNLSNLNDLKTKYVDLKTLIQFSNSKNYNVGQILSTTFPSYV